ncbi:PTS sugar transporter subunit IIB [Celerinatantimonas sp. YJH-8]|uniref:PTS sugar transporter subunit IIB n=1 Tax=Celerinatantimonas sp. YJH-8 TaxID=3228714 RepID=UPI0038C404B7
MKITVVCGNGLGSSLMMEIMIKKILDAEGTNYDIDHVDLSSVHGTHSDIYIGTRDITSQFSVNSGIVVSLDNIVDQKAMKEKILTAISQLNA